MTDMLWARWADRLERRVRGLSEDVRALPGGRLVAGERSLGAIRVRRRGVRLELTRGWPWPKRRALVRSAGGWAIWVTDEASLRCAVDIIRRTLWRARRRGALPGRVLPPDRHRGTKSPLWVGYEARTADPKS